MNKTAKRFVCGSLCAVLALGSLAGCSKKQSSKSADENTLTWWSLNSANSVMDSYDDMAAFQMLEEECGVNIEWIHPVQGQQNEQFGIVMASGDYPDLINFANWELYNGGPVAAKNDGIIIDLKDHINEEEMPNVVEQFELHPEWKKASTNYDGSIPVLGTYKDSQTINGFIGLTLRKDWLEKLNLEVPTTIDELTEVLRAFKNGDPNGNGVADEIPFSAEGIRSPYHYLSAAFGSSTLMMRDTNGKTVYGPIQPGFKDFLETMHMWYEEGLLDNEYIASDRATLDSKITTDVVGAYIGYTGSQMSSYLAARGNDGSGFDLVAAPWPKKNASSPAYTGFDGILNTASATNGVAVSSQNTKLDKTIKVLDWMMGKGSIALNYGVEGESYNVVDGNYVFTDEIVNNSELDAITALLPYAMPNYGIGGQRIFLDAYDKIAWNGAQQKQAAKTWTDCDTSNQLPPLTFTEEESATISKVKTDADILVHEYMTNVIIGQDSIDNFDSYVAKVKAFGIADMEAAYQAAYDRYCNA